MHLFVRLVRPALLLGLLLAAAGCREDAAIRSSVDAKDVGGIDAHSGSPTAETCAELAEQACEADKRCFALVAVSLQDHCRGSTTVGFVACVNGGPDGGPALTWAEEAATGKKARFASTQLPPGWNRISEPSCGNDAGAPEDIQSRCEDRTETTCEPAGCVPLRALGEDAFCRGTTERDFKGCTGAADGGGAETWASQGPGQKAALFPTTQLPSGWSRVSPPSCSRDGGVDAPD
jgi:hypothetical protein